MNSDESELRSEMHWKLLGALAAADPSLQHFNVSEEMNVCTVLLSNVFYVYVERHFSNTSTFLFLCVCV